MAAWLPVLPAGAVTPPFFNAMYWLKGGVTVDQSQEQTHPINIALSNRQVIIYKDAFPGPYVGAPLHAITINLPPPSKVKGDYMMNIIAEKKLPIVAGQSYKVAVVQGSDGYGMNPVDVTITDVGYITKDLVIKWGEGPVIPYGTVPMSIERAGNNIKVFWDNAVFEYQNPKIFMLAGDGTGKYTNDAGWAAINALLGPGSPFEGSDLPGGYIIHKNQVGQGWGEVYFKGIQNTFPNEMDINPNVPGNISYLASAWAVGKVNVTVAEKGGKQLVSLPLYDDKLSVIFPPQLQGGKSLFVSPRSGSGLNPVKVDGNGVVGQDLTVEPMVGFWMQTPIDATAPVTTTFVGGVIKADLERVVEMKDLTGNPMPISFSSGNLGVDQDIISVQSGLGLSPMIKSGGSWGQWTTVGLNQGFWYSYKANKRKWTVSPSILDVKVIQY